MALTWALQTPGNPTYACSLQRSNGSQFCGDFELIFHFGTTEEAGWRVDWTSAAMKLSCESVTNIVVMAVVSEAKVAVCVILWESLPPHEAVLSWSWLKWPAGANYAHLFHVPHWVAWPWWQEAGQGGTSHTLQVCKRLTSGLLFFQRAGLPAHHC